MRSVCEKDMREIVEVLSKAVGEICPGCFLRLDEGVIKGEPLPLSPWKEDVFRAEVLAFSPGGEGFVVHRTVGPAGSEGGVRALLLSRFEADGWPRASSGAEMSLKLATMDLRDMRGAVLGYVLEEDPETEGGGGRRTA